MCVIDGVDGVVLLGDVVIVECVSDSGLDEQSGWRII